MSNHLLNVTLQTKISSFMRLHRNLCFAVIDGILEVFNDGNYADKVICPSVRPQDARQIMAAEPAAERAERSTSNHGRRAGRRASRAKRGE